MKYLAIDYGIKRVGIAASDKEGKFAFPRCTMQRNTKAAFFANLMALIEEEKPDALVVGLPLHNDGKECLTTVQVRHFVSSLKRRTTLPVYFMNELLSSDAAEHELCSLGMSFKEVKKAVDQQAAVLILESFLNQPEKRRLQA